MCGYLTQRPQNITVYTGESVNVTCATNENKVNWEFVDNVGTKAKIYVAGFITLSFADRFSVPRYGEGDYTLSIINVTTSDRGTYTCIDRGGFGPDQVSAMLTVIGKINNLVATINPSLIRSAGDFQNDPPMPIWLIISYT